MRYSALLAIILGISCQPAFAAGNAQSASHTPEADALTADYSDTLPGKPGDRRSVMFTQGYDLKIVYKLDLLKNTSSPGDRIYGLDNLDLKFNLDFEKIYGLKGSSAFLHVISNRGDKPARHSGRLPHGMDNIETPENGNTTKLFQAWIQQSFLDDKASLLFGLYDLNSEFYATESSAMFIHPTFGIGAELADTGKNGPSIFPTSSVALRIKTKPAPGYYLQAIVLDGVPGDPDNPRGTHVQFNAGDGALNVIEGGIPLVTADTAHNNKLAFGVWQYTAPFDDVLDVDTDGNPVQRVSHGAYAIIEKVLRYQPDSDTELVSGFFRIGQAEGDTTQFDLALSTGLVFKGLFSGREQDELGLAYAQERNSKKYRIASGNAVYAEESIELGYCYRTMPGFIVQPLVQYLLNHSEDICKDKTR